MSKKMKPLSDPKSPAAMSTGMRVKKMPPFPMTDQKGTHRAMGPLPSLCDPKMSNPAYKGGTE